MPTLRTLAGCKHWLCNRISRIASGVERKTVRWHATAQHRVVVIVVGDDGVRGGNRLSFSDSRKSLWCDFLLSAMTVYL